MPALAADGWQVAYADDYPYRMAEGSVGWWADAGEGSGIDWFSFEIGIEYEGRRINLVPVLVNVLSALPPAVAELAHDPATADDFSKACAGLRLYHALPDGRLLALPGERIAPILRGLLELIGPRDDALVDGKIKLHRAEAGALAALAGNLADTVAWAASTERLISLGNDLRRGRTTAKAKPPKSFKASLRPYQQDGLDWLEFLRTAEFGGVLADDMGLGKTVQALAFLCREKAEAASTNPH